MILESKDLLNTLSTAKVSDHISNSVIFKELKTNLLFSPGKDGMFISEFKREGEIEGKTTKNLSEEVIKARLEECFGKENVNSILMGYHQFVACMINNIMTFFSSTISIQPTDPIINLCKQYDKICLHVTYQGMTFRDINNPRASYEIPETILAIFELRQNLQKQWGFQFISVKTENTLVRNTLSGQELTIQKIITHISAKNLITMKKQNSTRQDEKQNHKVAQSSCILS